MIMSAYAEESIFRLFRLTCCSRTPPREQKRKSTVVNIDQTSNVRHSTVSYSVISDTILAST